MTRSRSVAWATMIAIAGTLSTPFSVSAAPVAATAADACARQQGFYLRRNKLDISIYNASIDASAAEGAAISYTGDRENDTDTAEVHAVAAWVFARNPCSPIGEPPIGRPYVSGYAFAASVLGDGTLTADRTDEKSALKPGLDAKSKSPTGRSSLCKLSPQRPITRPTFAARPRPTAFRPRGNRTTSIGGLAAITFDSRGRSTSSTR